jgi:predicted DNA-binding protein
MVYKWRTLPSMNDRRKHYRFPRRLGELLAQEASRRGCTESQLVREILLKYFEQLVGSIQ